MRAIEKIFGGLSILHYMSGTITKSCTRKAGMTSGAKLGAQHLVSKILTDISNFKIFYSFEEKLSLYKGTKEP